MSTVISESGTLEGYEPDDLIPEVVEPEFIYTAPIAMRELPGTAPFLGTTITGRFKTTDDRTVPSLAFITAYRDIPEVEKPVAHYYDGYGIALRPSTDSDMLNVFVVDNSLTVPTVVLENVVHTGWGEMSYLAAIHADISPNIEYNFRLDINTANALRFWIWPASGSMILAPTLTYGAYDPQSEGRYLGISCSKTESYFWDWDALGVSYHDPRHAAQYFRLVCDDFLDTLTIRAYAYAEGYDDVSVASQYGIKMYVWNYKTAEWELHDEHTNGPGGLVENILLEAENLDVADYLGIVTAIAGHTRVAQVLLLATYPSEFDEAVDSTLAVDYIYAETWNTRSAHVGGMGDIYLKTSSNPTAASFDINGVDALERLSANNTHIDGDIEWPILWISSIQLLDGTGQPTGIILTPITNWAFGVYNPDLRFSTRDSCYLLFAGVVGANVRVNYYTEPAVASAQDILDSDTSRNVTDDYLAKAYTPFELYIEAKYVGSAHPTTVRDALALNINGELLTSVSYDDIEIWMQAVENLSNAQVTSMTALMHDTDGSVVSVSPTDETITLTDRQQFILVPDARHITLTRS